MRLPPVARASHRLVAPCGLAGQAGRPSSSVEAFRPGVEGVDAQAGELQRGNAPAV